MCVIVQPYTKQTQSPLQYSNLATLPSSLSNTKNGGTSLLLVTLSHREARSICT